MSRAPKPRPKFMHEKLREELAADCASLETKLPLVPDAVAESIREAIALIDPHL